MSDPMEAFEPWILQYVAHAVEAGEVSADLLAELRTEMERAKELPQEEAHVLAVRDLAERVDLPVERLENLLASFQVQPTSTRHRLLRQVVEVWLAGQRQASRSGPPAHSRGEDPRCVPCPRRN